MVYLDEDLPNHPKIFRAGAHFGPTGPAMVLALHVACIAYARKFLTDGFVPTLFFSRNALVPGLCHTKSRAMSHELSTNVTRTHDELPTNFSESDYEPLALAVANVMARRGIKLLHKRAGGFWVHDFDKWNQNASVIKKKREQARDRKRRSRQSKVVAGAGLSRALSRVTVSVTGEKVTAGQPRDPDHDHDHDHYHDIQRAAALPQRCPNSDPDPNGHYAVITAVVTKDILPRRLEDHRLMDETKTRCDELHITHDDIVVRKAIDSALFRYYRQLRHEYDLPPDPRGIYHDHSTATRSQRP